jgi:UrcA family protein
VSTKTLFATVTAAALVLSFSAQAAPTMSQSSDDNRVSVRVSVADLDLRKDAGTEIARRRLRHAANRACGEESHFLGLARYTLYRTCVMSTSSQAFAALDTRIAMARNGQPSDQAPILVSSR